MFGYKAFLTTSPTPVHISSGKIIMPQNCSHKYKDKAITTHKVKIHLFSECCPAQAFESPSNCDFIEHLQRLSEETDTDSWIPRTFLMATFSRTSLIRQRSKVDWWENCVTLFTIYNGNHWSDSKCSIIICKLPLTPNSPEHRAPDVQVHIWRLSND